MSALYIISTPIGNLEDITYRAVRLLGEAGVIACEDTRQTRKLLDHFSIQTPLVSYHQHNEASRTAELIAKLQAGETVALVSDAGTPLISDPGYRLVQAAINAGIAVVPVPGASALLAALAASGLPTDSFRFCGFLPPKSTQRRKILEDLKSESSPLVFYEAPHRILDALADIAEIFPANPVVVARELTKIHEEFLRGTAAEIRATLAARPAVRGEFVILIGKAKQIAPMDDTPVEDAVRALEQQGVSRMDAIKQVAKARGMSKRECYRLLNS